MDVWVDDAAVLVDGARLRRILEGAAESGSLTVLDEAFHVFPNGAVTGVLVLAQSHLSVHTWPEAPAGERRPALVRRRGRPPGGRVRPGRPRRESRQRRLSRAGPVLSRSGGRDVVATVAGAVRIAEGEAGVRAVLAAAARLEPVAVRQLSRVSGLPVPIVSAICNELRARGIVAAERPVQLTPLGRELFGGVRVDAECRDCAGHALVVPAALAPVARELAAFAGAAPPPRVELDQSHCTVDTKLRRVLALLEADALAGKRIVLLGDDDLTSVALKLVAEALGPRLAIGGLVVLDVDLALLGFLDGALAGAPFPVECAEHDLRAPLPGRLRGAADTVFTDPPYTAEGARLFLSRGVEAAGSGPGRDIFLALGQRRPLETLALQREIAAMGLVVRRLARNFNEYLGAGVLGGVSHLLHLGTTSETRCALTGRHKGPLYTGDLRPVYRLYRCKRCRATERVGRGQRWAAPGELRHEGCPRCGGDRFVPLTRTAHSRRA